MVEKISKRALKTLVTLLVITILASFTGCNASKSSVNNGAEITGKADNESNVNSNDKNSDKDIVINLQEETGVILRHLAIIQEVPEFLK